MNKEYIGDRDYRLIPSDHYLKMRIDMEEMRRIIRWAEEILEGDLANDADVVKAFTQRARGVYK